MCYVTLSTFLLLRTSLLGCYGACADDSCPILYAPSLSGDTILQSVDAFVGVRAWVRPLCVFVREVEDCCHGP